MLQSNALVIDSSPSMRNYVREILRHELMFNEVHEGKDANNALQILQSDHSINWIFSSWEMPGFSTHELLETIRSKPNTTHPHFVLMSANEEQIVRNIAIQEGVEDYLCKPFPPQQMIHMVHRIAGLTEQRGAARFKVRMPCEIDIGFDAFHRYGAELVDISMTGCRVKTSQVKAGSGYIDDYATITLLPENSSPFAVQAKIRRVALDEHHTDPFSTTEIAVEFVNITDSLNKNLDAFINACRKQTSGNCCKH